MTDDEKSGVRTLQVFSQIIKTGKTSLVLTTVRDMTKWISLEKQKQMSKLKTVAFASAAHEFKNPLNGIISALEILEPMITLNKQGEYIY